ncbi:MAG: hypothetical protein WBA54_03945 [Acidaminobacteraceae bacterium]
MKKSLILFIGLMLTFLFVACDVKSDDKPSESNSSLENTSDEEKIQVLSYQTYFTQEWYDMYSENGGEICRFIDYIFDGYTDVVTKQNGAMVNQYYGMWIYNSQTNKFRIGT